MGNPLMNDAQLSQTAGRAKPPTPRPFSETNPYCAEQLQKNFVSGLKAGGFGIHEAKG
jgi:hypothetical protein